MIRKLLIANRGEIACRIIHTCRKMNITSVAVYSDADEKSMHVLYADEAVYIGGARIKESYLNIEAVLQAAKDSGVDAVHPGYGLLSENPEFAARVLEEGITFIGPEAAVIKQMGDKIEARKLMEKAGVPVLPGTALDSFEEPFLIKTGRSIGYPLMVKAAAGGGGIGMEKIETEADLLQAVGSVRKKAETFFGSSLLFLEKYIEGPRHIEAQIVGDQYGTIQSLGTRDCSIQRRHQKVIEEAPAPFFSKEADASLQKAAVKAASALSYTNAGTVEFLVDKEENVYFLEMNTRLQVEHPVTEETTGTDLVEWQLLIADGVPFTQLPYNQRKHFCSMEVRLYAEDPKTFFPSPGTLDQWYFPESENVRFDMGVRKGDKITPYYDPMIGKVIAYGDTRETVINTLVHVLKNSETAGIKTNIPLLLDVLNNEGFQKGRISTHFLMQTN